MTSQIEQSTKYLDIEQLKPHEVSCGKSSVGSLTIDQVSKGLLVRQTLPCPMPWLYINVGFI